MIKNSSNEPIEEIIKLTAHMLDLKVKLFHIEKNNYRVVTYGPETSTDEVSIISS